MKLNPPITLSLQSFKTKYDTTLPILCEWEISEKTQVIQKFCESANRDLYICKERDIFGW